uniref:histone-lysine N-methyltransferase, H3 lysine-9 specific SUVH6-like n=1 Tax=Fragaria vesca subsp. vesca TaxID=101020 RepID=UPI0005CA00EA|nr:PREDICTED: histone-lysine N-methyltransferase, H3 lysine-9 specific SUVH6-like [Fragaria vesca subsp. vesca]
MVIEKSVPPLASSKGTLSRSNVPFQERLGRFPMEIGECSSHTKPPEGKSTHRRSGICDVSLGSGPRARVSSLRPIREAASVGISKEEMATGEESHNEDGMRMKVKAAQRSFWFAFRTLKDDDPKGRRFDAKAAKVVKASGRSVNEGKPIIGIVPGGDVGDDYTYRAQLGVIGLHRPIRAGIDFVRHGGKRLATSIVASGSYEDDIKNKKSIKYTGHGGNYMNEEKKKYDQKLERGNLALRNSFYMKNLVRLIHRIKNSDGEYKYVYKGLFLVTKCSRKRGRHGKLLWEFHLVFIHKG